MILIFIFTFQINEGDPKVIVSAFIIADSPYFAVILQSSVLDTLYSSILTQTRQNTGLFIMIVGVQLSSGKSAPNSGNNHHLTILFEGDMHSFKRQGACVSRN